MKPFTSYIECGYCGKYYTSSPEKLAGDKKVQKWFCYTKRTKCPCPTKRRYIPEFVLTDLVCDVLNIEEYDVKANETAKILHSLKINLNFAPVADVSSNQKSFIYSRTLGLDYQQIADCIQADILAIHGSQVAASLKHFPGYGTVGDTHTGIASTNKSLKDFEKNDFLPFKAGIKAGAQMVLVSHIFVNSIDSNYPSSLSPKIHQLLRQKLHFKKVIITDDLPMGAITQFAAKKHVSADLLAVKAGNDMLLSNDISVGVPLIMQAVNKQQIKETQINASVYRILKLKRDLGILNKMDFR